MINPEYAIIENTLEETIEAMWGFPYKNRDNVVKMIHGSMEKNSLSSDDLFDLCKKVVEENAGAQYMPNASVILDKMNHRKVHNNVNLWNSTESCERCHNGIGYTKELVPVICKCPKGQAHPDKKHIPYEDGEGVPWNTPIEELIDNIKGEARERLKKRLSYSEEFPF